MNFFKDGPYFTFKIFYYLNSLRYNTIKRQATVFSFWFEADEDRSNFKEIIILLLEKDLVNEAIDEAETEAETLKKFVPVPSKRLKKDVSKNRLLNLNFSIYKQSM